MVLSPYIFYKQLYYSKFFPCFLTFVTKSFVCVRNWRQKVLCHRHVGDDFTNVTQILILKLQVGKGYVLKQNQTNDTQHVMLL